MFFSFLLYTSHFATLPHSPTGPCPGTSNTAGGRGLSYAESSPRGHADAYRSPLAEGAYGQPATALAPAPATEGITRNTAVDAAANAATNALETQVHELRAQNAVLQTRIQTLETRFAEAMRVTAEKNAAYEIEM